MRPVGGELFRADWQTDSRFSPISRVRLKPLLETYTVTAQKSAPERLKDPPVRRLSLLTTPERAINSSRWRQLTGGTFRYPTNNPTEKGFMLLAHIFLNLEVKSTPTNRTFPGPRILLQ
jgi:hypothetical protein